MLLNCASRWRISFFSSARRCNNKIRVRDDLPFLRRALYQTTRIARYSYVAVTAIYCNRLSHRKENKTKQQQQEKTNIMWEGGGMRSPNGNTEPAKKVAGASRKRNKKLIRACVSPWKLLSEKAFLVFCLVESSRNVARTRIYVCSHLI